MHRCTGVLLVAYEVSSRYRALLSLRALVNGCTGKRNSDDQNKSVAACTRKDAECANWLDLSLTVHIFTIGMLNGASCPSSHLHS